MKEFIENLKEKIKQVGIESKKYLADPNHPYHKPTGFLKFQIICSYIGIVLLVISSIMFIYYFFIFDFLGVIKLVRSNLGIAGSFLIILLIIYVAIYIALFVFVIVFLKKLKNKDSDYLLFYHNMCVVAYALMFILLFFDFIDAFFSIIWFTIMIAIFTYYYCTSVKVRVYFGGDDFLKKDHYIHFLLDDKNINETKAVVNTPTKVSNESVPNNVSTNENSIINNEDEIKLSNADGKNENIVSDSNDIKDNLSNNENKQTADIETIDKNDLMDAFKEVQKESYNKNIDTKQQNVNDKNSKPSVKLIADSNKVVVSKQIKHENYNVNTRVNNSYKTVQKNSNKKSNIFVRFLKFLLSAIIKLFLLIVLVFTLINFDGKYQVSDAPFFKKIFTVIDNVTGNLFAHKGNSVDNVNVSNNEMQVKNAQASNSGVDEDLSSEEIKSDNKDAFSKESTNNNIDIVDETTSSVNEIERTEKISRNAVELSTNIKKINLKGAKWQFNEKQQAWNLLINKKVSKDVIYIIDYINPITGKPCSSTYGFDFDGRMIVGWGIDVSGDYYYFDDSTYDIGKMCTGWKQIENDYYFFLPNGKLLTNDYTSDGYYVDINGKRIANSNINDNNSENVNKSIEHKNKSTR